MKKFVMTALFLFFLSFCIYCKQTQKADKISTTDNLKSNNKLYLNKNNDITVPDSLEKEIKESLNITSFTPLGKITTNNNQWYILKTFLQGETFTENSLHLFPQCHLNIADSLLSARYSLPGKCFSFDDTLIYESRVFYGQCLNDNISSIVWDQKELNNSNEFVPSVFVIEFHDFSLNKYFITQNMDSVLSVIENHLNEKKCV